MKKILLVMAVMAMTAGLVSAFDTTAFQIGVWAPKVQLVPPEIALSGLKLNLPYGNNGQVTGLDLGLVSINREQNDQLNAHVSALQVNLWNSTNGAFAGVQVGLYNEAVNSAGIKVGLINNTANMSRGVEVGLINTSLECHGLQVGLINYTEFLTGVQIGLVNIATKSTLPFFPIINMCF